MGFPYDEATWNAVSEVMFMGWGGSMPGVFSTIGLIVCVVAIVLGNKAEQKCYLDHKNDSSS